MAKYILIDLIDYLRPNFGTELKEKPLFYSVKGINIHICRTQLAELRELTKTLTIVHNPSRKSRLTLLDIRQMLITFSADISNIVSVDTELFRQEEEMASVFRSEDFYRYHVKSSDMAYNVLLNSEEHLAQKIKYYKTHLKERLLEVIPKGEVGALTCILKSA